MDMFLSKGGDYSEGPPPDEMIGLLGLLGVVARMGLEPEQRALAGGPDRLSPSDRLSEALTPQLKHGGNRGQTSSELPQTALLSHSLKIAELITVGFKA